MSLFPLSEKSLTVWEFEIPKVFSTSPFWAILSEEEKKKAQAFIFQRDRVKYIFCRGALRFLLSHYTSVPPEIIQLEYTSTGKPYLPNKVTFNLSHTSDRMVVAFSFRNQIGVDIEKIRPVSDYLEISKESFSYLEYEYIHQQNKEKQLAAFFCCWVRKEALLKGIGIGISGNSSYIQKVNSLESVVFTSQEKWTIQNLKESPSYLMAVAYTGSVETIEYREEPWERLLSF